MPPPRPALQLFRFVLHLLDFWSEKDTGFVRKDKEWLYLNVSVQYSFVRWWRQWWWGRKWVTACCSQVKDGFSLSRSGFGWRLVLKALSGLKNEYLPHNRRSGVVNSLFIYLRLFNLWLRVVFMFLHCLYRIKSTVKAKIHQHSQ